MQSHLDCRQTTKMVLQKLSILFLTIALLQSSKASVSVGTENNVAVEESTEEANSSVKGSTGTVASGTQDENTNGVQKFVQKATGFGKSILEKDIEAKTNAIKALDSFSGSIGGLAGSGLGGFAGKGEQFLKQHFTLPEWQLPANPFAGNPFSSLYSGAKGGLNSVADSGDYFSGQLSKQFQTQGHQAAVQGDNLLKKFGVQNPILSQLDDNSWNAIENGRSAAYQGVPSLIPNEQLISSFPGLGGSNNIEGIAGGIGENVNKFASRFGINNKNVNTLGEVSGNGKASESASNGGVFGKFFNSFSALGAGTSSNGNGGFSLGVK